MSTLQEFHFKGAKKTCDLYLYHSMLKSLSIIQGEMPKEWIRIRQKDDKSYLTYKKDLYDGSLWTHSEELETEVVDANIMKAIFANFIDSLHLNVSPELNMGKPQLMLTSKLNL